MTTSNRTNEWINDDEQTKTREKEERDARKWEEKSVPKMFHTQTYIHAEAEREKKI